MAAPAPVAGSHSTFAAGPEASRGQNGQTMLQVTEHTGQNRRKPTIMYLNRLTLIGFTGGDADMKTGNNGSTFTVFSMATKRSWTNADGEWESRTEWHRCLAFGKLGDFAAGLKKGAHVQVEGELRSREYDKDGVKHKVFECCLESILKLDRAARREEPDAGHDSDA